MKNSILNCCVLFALLLFVACEEGAFESYRYELWKKLVDDNYQFDLIGTQNDGGDYPNYKGQNFDRDHVGMGGIETDGVLENLEEVLDEVEQPDLVLLEIGGNDLVGAQFIAKQYFRAIKNHFSPNQQLKILTIGDSRVEGARPSS